MSGGESPRIRRENVNMSKKIVASSLLVTKPKVPLVWAKQSLRRFPMGDGNKRTMCQEIIKTKDYCCKLTQVGDSGGESFFKELGKLLAFIRS